MAKKGGSQLAQLKNRAVTDGLHGGTVGGKKRSSSQAGDAKARKRTEARSALGDAFASTFDTKVTKQKRDILTRTSIAHKNAKGTVGRPSESKSAAMAAREAALRPQLQDRHKSGAFVDRRFGENDPSMSVEQRMLERFTAERKRQMTSGSANARRAGKASLFNLDDSEDEGLTHFGQSLSGMDDGMLGAGLGNDNEDDVGPEQTYNPFDDELPEGVAHEDSEGKPRSKEDIMAEVMLKSKNAKHERQKAREQDEETRFALDDALEEIKTDLLMMQPAPARPTDASAAAPGPTAENPATGANATPASGGSTYDALYRSLVYERRAQPTDRMKTDEERAAEEAGRLQAAERERLRRMRGDSDDEAAAEDEAVVAGAGKRKRVKMMERRERGADDLDDDFAVEGVSAGEAYGLGQGLAGAPDSDDKAEGENPDESEEDDSTEGDEEEAEEDSESDESENEEFENHEHNYNDLADLNGMAVPGEEMDSDEEAVAGGETEALVGGAPRKKAPRAQEQEKSDLPYTFPAPESHEDFIALLVQHKVATQQVPTVIKRIRTLYNPSIGPQNRERTETLLGVLVDHVLYLGGQAQEAAKGDHAAMSSKEAVSLLNTIFPHIHDLTKLFPETAAQIFCMKLALMQRNLTRGLAAIAAGRSGRTWPSFAELSFLRLVGLIWPTSDRSHPVATAAQILMAHYLAHSRIRSTSAAADTAAGLYLVSLCASYEKESKRVVPEAINFLQVVLLGLAPLSEMGRKAGLLTAAEYGVAVSHDDVASLEMLRPKSSKSKMIASTDDALVIGEAAWSRRADLLGLLAQKGQPPDAGVQLLSQTAKLIDVFARLYAGSEAYVDIFRPLLEVVRTAKPGTADLAALQAGLERRVQTAQARRRFLRLQAHRAKALDMHAPKFSVSGVSTDPDQERAEAQKLRALHKKERKSTIRELRRDARFTASLKEKEQEEEDARYKKHIDRIMADLQTERSEQKKHEREKANLKR